MIIKLDNQTPFSTKTTASVPGSRIPLSSVDLSSLKNKNLYNVYNKKRPLKTNSKNLAFKGLSLDKFLYKDTKVEKDVVKGYAKDELKIAQKVLGSEFEDLYKYVKTSDAAKKMFSAKTVDGKETAFFKAKTPLLLVFDGILYPFKILPGDLLNGIVSGLRKVKPFKNWAEKTYNGKFLKGLRHKSKNEAQVNSLRGMFETIEKAKKEAEIKFAKTEDTKEKQTQINKYIQDELFSQAGKMFNPKTGHYDTKHERSLCRIVSGAIPAVFLANDAYNLASACSGNTKDAKKEQKVRFKQEVSRVGFNAYLTLITMGALQKHINKSKASIVLTTGITVLLTEMFSRLSNGKDITMISPEKARRLHAKQMKNNNAEVSADSVKTAQNTKTDNKNNDKKQKAQEPLLSLHSIGKACLAIIATGFAIKGLRTYKGIDKQFVNVKDAYNKIYDKLTINNDYKISKQKLDTIIKGIREAGFDDLADSYEQIIAKLKLQKGQDIHLGKKNKKIKPLVDFVKTPFKFIYDAISLPYRMTNKLVQILTHTKADKKSNDEDKQLVVLKQSIDKIWTEALNKGKKYDKKKLKDFIQDNIAKSFNAETMSSIPNNELANLAKNSATAATIWFLMADNYNMVMIKSNGEDKTGAQLKAKQRVVQEASRLFYQTLLIDLFNSTFRTQYNNSLFGMSWITAIDTTIGEILTRKSVGMPIKPHSQAQLNKIEQKKENATGFEKSYYDFMTKLTGKQSLKEQRVAKQNKDNSKKA